MTVIATVTTDQTVNSLQSHWGNINYSKNNYEINIVKFFRSYSWWDYLKSFEWSRKLNVQNICKGHVWEHLWMAAYFKCPLRFPVTTLIPKDINVCGNLFLQFFANLSQFFSMKIAFFSYLLKHESTKNMPETNPQKICLLKLVNIVKLFANVKYVTVPWLWEGLGGHMPHPQNYSELKF